MKTWYDGGTRGPATFRRLIREELRKDEYVEKLLPTEGQIKRQLDSFKAEIGAPIETIADLEFWIQEHLNIPINSDEPFVIGYKIVSGNKDIDEGQSGEKRIWVLLSSKRLLELASTITTLCADSTYKLLQNGFAVPIFGTVDANKSFRGLAIGFTNSESKETWKEMTKVFIALIISAEIN